MNQKKSDIMDNILGGFENDAATSFEELDCLIYKNDSNIKHEVLEHNGDKIWQASKENVSVQIWEGKAKIKVKISAGDKKISMEQIAKVALNAIVKELKKED